MSGKNIKKMWVARDKNGCIFAYSIKPYKNPHGRWDIPRGAMSDLVRLDEDPLWDRVKWEDIEPHELIIERISDNEIKLSLTYDERLPF